MKIASYINDLNGKSFNALEAETRGLFPASNINYKYIQENICYNIPVGILKKYVNFRNPEEWHHTGLYARRTNYHSVKRICGELNNIFANEVAFRKLELAFLSTERKKEEKKLGRKN